MINLKITVTIATPGPDAVRISSGGGVPTAASRRRVYFTEGWFETPVYDRAKLGAEDRIAGPALIEEAASVTVLCPQQELRVDETGNLCLSDAPRAR